MTTPNLVCYNCGNMFGSVRLEIFGPSQYEHLDTPCAICGRDDKPVYDASLFGTIDTSKHEWATKCDKFRRGEPCQN